MAKRPTHSNNKPKKKKKLSKKKKNLSIRAVLPSQDDIEKFARGEPGLVGKDAIARHFNLGKNQRAGLKGLLKKMRANGRLPPLPGERSVFDQPVSSRALKPTGVLRAIGLDENGEMLLEPVNWDSAAQGPAPVIVLAQAARKQRLRADTQALAVGNLVLARITPQQGEDDVYNARILKHLVSNEEAMLGVVRQRGETLRIIPTDKKSRFEYDIAPKRENGARPGDLVRFETQRARPGAARQAKVLERLGSIGDFRNISLIALADQEIAVHMPEAVEAEAAGLKPFSHGQSKYHKDMRDVPLITIDPPDARDHDDAIWAQADDDPKNPGGVKIIVAIADVAHYVASGSKLDIEAQRRGNSTYLPDRVVPMLPEKLSNELCSLKDGVDRPALACFMTFDCTGKKTRHHFDRIVMKSAAKLSYRQAQDAIDGKPDAIAAPLLENILKPLWDAYALLRKGRDKRQPLELDIPERKLIFDKNGLMSGVVMADRFDAHKLVEEFMIQANVAAAESLEKHNVPVIYRIHDAPAAEKLDALADFLRTLNLSAPKGQVMRPANFNSILSKVAGTEHEHVVNQVMLRSQSQAVYSTENLGHFGLNLRRYAHFTSPIRRYADLTVHRGLIRAFELGNDGLRDSETGKLNDIAEEISKSERRSMVAERDTKDRMIAGFLSEKIGHSFSGRIGGVARAGLFVTLEGTGADGFVPVATLQGDYYVHDESAMAMVGERTGETYRIGDKVTVQLKTSAPVSGGLQLEMISKGQPGKPAPRRKRRFSRKSGPRRR